MNADAGQKRAQGGAQFAALARLHGAAFAGRARAWSADEIAALAAAPGALLIVEGAPPAGFALARVVADEAEIVTFAVDPARRRQGVGALLLARLAETARGAGAAALLLEVDADNGPALALYRGAGFAQVGLRRDYTRAGIDALVLRAALAG